MVVSQDVEVTCVKEGFVAEVAGLDLGVALSPEWLEEIRAAWAAYPVLCFPNQRLSIEQLEDFTRQLGEFGVDPFVAPMDGHPNVLEVRRGAEEKGVVFGGAWHSDWSFQERPPSATLLYAKVVPPVGGDTLYADCCRAWRVLPEELKQIVLDKRAVHSARLAYGESGSLAKDPHPRAMKILTGEAAHATRLHPIVRTHPVTGRPALFVNPVYTVGVESMDDEQGRALLARLYETLLDEAHLYRHRWRENMLLVWDNRRVVHNAQGGYEGHARLMYRTTVAGEKPALSR